MTTLIQSPHFKLSCTRASLLVCSSGVFSTLLFSSLCPAAGTPIDTQSLRVVTLNLDQRNGERADRLKNAVGLLERLRPDLILLQEVSSGLFQPGDPLETLNTTLQLNLKNYWHETNLGLYRTGIAILSRYPISQAHYHDFRKHELFQPKGFMSVHLETPLGSLQVVNVDLDSETKSESIRQDELVQLKQFVLEGEARPEGKKVPLLMGGSFGGPSTEPAYLHLIRELKLESPEEAVPTWTEVYKNPCNSVSGQKRDHFLSRSPITSPPTPRIQFLNSEVVVHTDLPHPSDHCAVASVLNFTQN